MADLRDLMQSADWKTEKHVPVIEGPDKISKGQFLEIEVSVGKQIAHPNTTEHHIKFIEVYFLAAGEKFPCQLACFEFNTHGESVQGPNTSTIFTEPKVSAVFKTEKSGLIMAVAYCNIHGLWRSEKEIKVE
ncbi:MAG TPA: class II SORL domain-containing protein [Candidatus Omnitrophota bacterium]|nr:class II SORL domain-containing protein [Candidatus Omnitrophota bacterium]HPT38755.1 class II SORL domain-containing protein [Candidatus Omnitrophota bacterium]